MAVDAKQNIIVTPINDLPAVVQLIPRDSYREAEKTDKFSMEFAPQHGTPYGVARRLLLSPAGLPCNAPPWGILAGIDANSGQVKWRVPLGKMGEFPGAINLGGPITLPSGVTFIGATLDGYFRAFRTATGEQLWEVKLPASARATPMVYTHRGRQYVAIAAGGHDPKFGPLDDKLVVFALPK
jgi:quinoprotein glucose dehydrogenase